MTARRRAAFALCCTAAMFAPLACSSDSKGSGSNGEFSVASSLEQIPASVRGDTVLLTMSDLDAATKAAGVDRPPAGTTDVDEIAPWLSAIAGPVQEGDQVVSVILPRVSQYQRFAQMAEFRDELGWSLTDVHTFVEYAVPPNDFTVMTGAFDDKTLSRALGTAEDGVWKLGEDDNSIDIDQISAARPLGEALRLSLEDGHLAVARSTPPVTAWRTGDGPTLADDTALHDVATALDDADVYSAELAEMDFTRTATGLSDEANADGTGGIGAFRALGIGLSVVDSAPRATFVYAFDGAEAARDAVPVLTALLTKGESAVTGRPWSELLTVQDVTSKGNVLIASLSLADMPVSRVWSLLGIGDNLTAATPD